MAKQIIYDTNVKEKILSGISKLEKAVAVTLGPCGKNVIINEYGQIHSTKDGVTVARSIELEDPFENVGINAIKEVAEKSNSSVGDGTTTSTVLASEIFRKGLNSVNKGSNVTSIINGMNKTVEKSVEIVNKIKETNVTPEIIEKVATVSANGDNKIGKIISDILVKLGNDGSIKIENGNTTEITSEIREGMVLNRTYASPYMISNPETLESELENPFIYITDKKITNIQDIIQCLQFVIQQHGSLLMIADDYQEDVLATLVMNKLRGQINVVAIKAPSYGSDKKNILEDVAVLTGAKIISDETGVGFGIDTLGRAKKVVCNKESTLIMGGMGDKTELAVRIENIRNLTKNMTEEHSDYVRIKDRLARLTTGIGIIHVGGITDTEIREKRDRVDDAFSAAKAAIKNGIVTGGGCTLLIVKALLNDWIERENKNLNKDEVTGANIIINSLNKPIFKIIENSGIEDSEIIYSIIGSLSNIYESYKNSIIKDKDAFDYDESYEKEKNKGYNVLAGKICDMIDAGIIDPADVVINEIRNSVSIAGLLLNTECIIVDKPKPEPQAQAPMLSPQMM